jgi:hypothetical protein
MSHWENIPSSAPTHVLYVCRNSALKLATMIDGMGQLMNIQA